MPSFYSRRIAYGTALLWAAVACLGYFTVKGKEVPWNLAVTLLIIGAVLVTKWAATDIHWAQVGLCCLVILGVHFVGAHFTWAPAYLIADKLIEAICILGFGTYWVKRGYLPKSANRW